MELNFPARDNNLNQAETLLRNVSAFSRLLPNGRTFL